MKILKVWSQLQVLLCLLATPWIAVADTGGAIFESSLGDYREELENARAQGKKGVLLMLEKNGCPFCARMKETVLNQPEVMGFYKKHFVLFVIDMDDMTPITDFQGNPATHKSMAIGYNPLGTTPVFVFVDLAGRGAVRYIGASSGTQEFLWWGAFVVEGQYLRTNFTRYKKMMKMRKGQL